MQNNKKIFFLLLSLIVIIKISLHLPSNPKEMQIKNTHSTPESMASASQRNPSSTPSRDISFHKKNPSSKPMERWKKKMERQFKSLGVTHFKTTVFSSRQLQREGRLLSTHVVLVEIPNETRTKFKILVDAESGKILQTWDRPVFERNDDSIDATAFHPLIAD